MRKIIGILLVMLFVGIFHLEEADTYESREVQERDIKDLELPNLTDDVLYRNGNESYICYLGRIVLVNTGHGNSIYLPHLLGISAECRNWPYIKEKIHEYYKLKAEKETSN